MRFEDLENIFKVQNKPWEHDYYVAYFADGITAQTFLDKAYLEIENLSGIWYHVTGNTAYFLVKKETTIPENFATTLEAITDVPTEPVIEEE